MRLFETPRDARRFLRDLVLALSAPLLVILFLVQPFKVEGRSMEPGLHQGERILVDKFSRRISTIARGDVVVFRHPKSRSRLLVKRVVALPGETVEIKGGFVHVQGSPLGEPWLPPEYRGHEACAPTTLGPSEYYVLGDHRDDSEDSRSWGPIDRSLIVGRAVLAYWPWSELGRVR